MRLDEISRHSKGEITMAMYKGYAVFKGILITNKQGNSFKLESDINYVNGVGLVNLISMNDDTLDEYITHDITESSLIVELESYGYKVYKNKY